MKKIVIFYTFSAFLLVLLHWHEGSKIQKTRIPSKFELFVTNQFKPIILKASTRNTYIRLVTGMSVPLDHKIRNAIDRCFLWSLFSLNGLHLYLIIYFFIRKRWSFKKRFFKTIKRNINYFEKPNTEIFLDFFVIFLTSITIILFKSLASGCFYFILVGTFYISKDESKKDSVLLFVMTYLLFTIYFEKNFSISGVIISTILFWLYKKSFGTLLAFFILGLCSIKNIFLNQIAEKIYSGIIFLGGVATIDQTHAALFLFFILFFAVLTKKYQVLIFFFIFHAEPVFSPIIFYSK